MKKVLLLLGFVATMAIGSQAFAACPCDSPCPVAMPCPSAACPVATPCPCPTTNCDPCCDNCGKSGQKKCTWWKIFEDKCCCTKCDKCYKGCTAKRCHWWKFWEDRRCVSNDSKCCDDCNKCNKCNDCCD